MLRLFGKRVSESNLHYVVICAVANGMHIKWGFMMFNATFNNISVIS